MGLSHIWTVGATRVLVVVASMIWFGMALLIALGLHPALPQQPAYRWLMGILALVASIGLITCYSIMRRGRTWAYNLLAVMLLGIVVLSVMDQFGWVDLLVLVIHLSALTLLLMDRRHYLDADAVV